MKEYQRKKALPLVRRISGLLGVVLLCSLKAFAQEVIVQENDTVPVAVPDTVILTDTVLVTDTIPIIEDEFILPDSTVQEAYQVADSVFRPETPEAVKRVANFYKPNSTKAVLFGLIPGMGQIYNRKYWKLPLVYGGFMGFMYAITWNNKMYQDYYHGYMDYMHDKAIFDNPEVPNPENWSTNWTDFITSGDYESYLNNSSFQETLRRRKDYFRRYRDLSIILAVGFYAITIIDAYVDAELFDFDISPDLSLRVEPMVSPRTKYNPATFGVNLSFTF